ncbi:MAG: deoxyribodipyrimidine photo-lyase, partial [Bacteroidota bacterium]
MVVFWFRRDLRIDDNTALYEAIASGEKILPIFILDKNILDELPKDDARVTFIMAL